MASVETTTNIHVDDAVLRINTTPNTLTISPVRGYGGATIFFGHPRLIEDMIEALVDLRDSINEKAVEETFPLPA